MTAPGTSDDDVRLALAAGIIHAHRDPDRPGCWICTTRGCPDLEWAWWVIAETIAELRGARPVVAG